MNKHYAERDPRKLEPHYSAHVMAMTAEKLHSKADIAAELAFRDKENKELRDAMDEMAVLFGLPEERRTPVHVVACAKSALNQLQRAEGGGG